MNEKLWRMKKGKEERGDTCCLEMLLVSCSRNFNRCITMEVQTQVSRNKQ